MIYSSEIQIPILCPLYFGSNRESFFYRKQDKYVPKIISDINIFFWISEKLYNGNNLSLGIKNEFGVITYESLDVSSIGSGDNLYYYCYGTIEKGLETKCVTFQLWDDKYTLLADTIIYEINPIYDKDLKIIQYTHYENDYDMVFFTSAYIHNHVYNSALNPSNNSITLLDVTGLSVGDKVLSICGTDVSSLSITISEINNLTIVFSQDVNTYFIQNTPIVFQNIEAKRDQFTYNICVECGFIPSDFETKDNVEDFNGQDMLNNIVDARPTAIEPLTVGDNFGIPNWLALKIDAITILSDFKIDGESFVRASGEKFEKVDSTEGLQVWRINLQSKENNYIPFKIFDNNFAYEFN